MAVSLDNRIDQRSVWTAPVQPVGPQRFVPPTARELRVQAVHRLQVGLFGLFAMLLIVGLANIIMARAKLADRLNATPVGVAASTAAAQKPADPLADIGVVPAADPSAVAAPAKAP